jgi:hypothetical protein
LPFVIFHTSFLSGPFLLNYIVHKATHPTRGVLVLEYSNFDQLTFKNPSFSGLDYWVGLVRQGNDRVWVADCTNLTYTANFADDYNVQEECFRHTRGDHIGVQKDCFTSLAFLCQVPLCKKNL